MKLSKPGFLFLLSLLGIYIAISAIFIAKVPMLVDFNVFYLAGELFWKGDLYQAYDIEYFFALQQQLSGRQVNFLWSYPPQYNLLTVLMAFVPVGVAYVLFIGATLAMYLWVLRTLAAEHFQTALILNLPAFIATIDRGQNGFLTASLLGLVSLCILRFRNHGGVYLGILSFKPHIALGIGVLALLDRRFKLLALAVAVTIALLAIATGVFGTGIWAAFQEGISDTSQYLDDGNFLYFGMVSVYAAARSLNFSADFAVAAQGFMALVALVTICFVHFKGWQMRRQLAMTLLASTLISPYFYLYDLCLLSVAFALIASDLQAYAGKVLKFLVVAGSWFASGYGVSVFTFTGRNWGRILEGSGHYDPYSLGFFGVLILFLSMFYLLNNAER